MTQAAEVTLAWDRNTEPDVDGYRLHYGTRSRNYNVSVDVGNVTTYRLSLPSGGQTYFFALTAYNTSQLESDFSNEISYNSGPAEEPLPDDPGDDTFSFQPTEDAYLQGTKRFNDNTLKVEAGYRVSYLKFAVSGLSGTVQSATLRLQENGDTGSGTLRVLRGSHNNWTESTLTTANAPAEKGQLGTFTGGVAAAQVVNINVTPLVTGNGTYSVILEHAAGGNDVWLGSGESTRKPQLIIATSGSGSVTYPLTVNSGTGTGSYAAGTTVNIAAAAAPAGQVFDRWTGSTANVANVNAASTSITMPSAATTVTATYKASGSSGSTWTFQPTEDAYLQGTKRFNDNTLKVEAGYRVSYLKFAVGGLSGTVQSATLRLQENGDTGSGTLRVLRGSHNNWTESTLTTANAPAENGQVGTFTGGVAAARVVNINVTPLVTGNGTYSVILEHAAGGNDVWLGSGESTRKPQLIIATSGNGSTLTVDSPNLEMAWDPETRAWQLIWPGAHWVLQESSELEDAWTDVSPPAASPHPVTMDSVSQFFRLRLADQQ